jgi:uncharacterized protein YjbI with pentapeptide repeats
MSSQIPRQTGDQYQGRLFWLKACALLRGDDDISTVGFERRDAKSFDDVVVTYGGAKLDERRNLLEADHYQVKFHMRGNGSISWADLMDKNFINAQRFSLLMKLRDAQRSLAPTGEGRRFILYTVWYPDPSDLLGQLYSAVDGSIRLDDLFTGPAHTMGVLRANLRAHLGVTDDQLRLILTPFRIETVGTFEALGERVNEQLRLVGLRTAVPGAIASIYDASIPSLLRAGRTIFTRDELIEECRKARLLETYSVGPPTSPLPITSQRTDEDKLLNWECDRRVQLRGAKCPFAKLEGIDLQRDTAGNRANLRDSNLYGTWLNDATLTGAIFINADLRYAKLARADMSSTDLTEARLHHAWMREVHLNGAIAEKVTLSLAILDKATMEGIKLQGAQMRGVDLSSAIMNHADLRGADLSTAWRREDRFENLFDQHPALRNIVLKLFRRWARRNLKATGRFYRRVDKHLRPATLQYAKLSGAKLSRADMGDADLNSAQLQGAELIEVDMPRGWLVNANLQDANLTDANLQDANLTGANLQDANLTGANLQGTNLGRANLWNAKLQGANLSGARLEGANLRNMGNTVSLLMGTNLSGIHYDNNTAWPHGFKLPKDAINEGGRHNFAR